MRPHQMANYVAALALFFPQEHLRALKGRSNSVRPAHRMCFGSAGPTYRTQIASLLASEAMERG